ncbi:MAG: glycosyltransferase family 2 protein [Pseudomonadota bacterium]
MPKLSVILITKNEASHIVQCLDSVHFADEWIVVDSGSTDATVALAREWGATVYIHEDWLGFGIQKNRALAYATGDWLLSIDADERVPEALAIEIQKIIQDGHQSIAGYTMPRLSSYCGHFMRHGGWWPDRVLRLFKREQSRFSDRQVHEKVEIKGQVGQLTAHLIHYTHPNLEAVLNKMNTYSTAGAAVMQERGRSGGILKACFHGFWAFIRAYIFRAGFLDGAYGFMAAISHAEGTYYRYVKCWLMKHIDNQK